MFGGEVMEQVQKRMVKVLKRMIDLCKEDVGYAENFSDDLQLMLYEYLQDDFFGTEGQEDPRGDFRDGEWSMYWVKGVDE